jgi:small subunit ribosomal protein S17
MAEVKTTTATADSTAAAAPATASKRNEKVGLVVSTKMAKTIVVETEMRKAHPKYKRVLKSNKKFYAHDEQNSATWSASASRARCRS